jgi:phage terminase large subunit
MQPIISINVMQIRSLNNMNSSSNFFLFKRAIDKTCVRFKFSIETFTIKGISKRNSIRN